MTGKGATIDLPSERQRNAADPISSHWLSANAGSGKTRVLIDRVVRLLYGGTLPQRILCLTYTKAAAAEMQNRLFRLLGGWAMMPEEELREALSKLGITGPIGADDIRNARRLFAQAIEAPGGLRIQTIHAFCASLLRRFPLEAGVSPGFSELDDAATAALRAEVLEDIATSADAPVLDTMAAMSSDDGIEKLVAEICARRDHLEQPKDRDAVLALFGLPAGYRTDDLLAEVFIGGEADLAREVTALLSASGPNDRRIAEAFADARLEVPTLRGLEAIEAKLLLTKPPFSAKTGTIPTKAFLKSNAFPPQQRLDELIRRVEAARPKRVALKAAERTHALLLFAQAFLPRYRARKAERGLLDFDDLVRHAAALVSDHSLAQWVLYRLDGGLDHMLIDEAQDTSPAQWHVIERLAEEFTAGTGASRSPRTIFVVGDKKQSIYSFQGADLMEFDRMQAKFRGRLQPQALWAESQLEHSFRSSEAILRVVDATFVDAHHPAVGGRLTHLAYGPARPGRVDLWSPEARAEKTTPEDYFAPLLLQRERDADERLAERIATEIRRMIDDGTTVTLRNGTVKAVDEGDILILVQRRTRLFHPIIRACKVKGLTVAGSDRLRLGGELAVKDLVALMNFLALPEDDLSLAAALRSPLFGWSEAQLFALAEGRGKGVYLWQALRDRAAEFSDVLSILDDLRDRADYLRPFDLIDRALTRHGLREKLVGRLGQEAVEGIDELLAQALAYEAADVPSLTGFLVRLATEEPEAKRRFEAGARALRVMTVHGAKGLEAPIVILPDTAKPDKAPQLKENILVAPGSVPFWKVPKDEAPPVLASRVDSLLKRQAEEKLRLLYVAMTRAESWLIVAAAGEVGTGSDSWYSMIRDGMEVSGGVRPEPGEAPDHVVLRVGTGQWTMPGTGATQQDAASGEILPGWLKSSAPPAPRDDVPLAASSLPGPKALPGEAGLPEDEAKLRGTALHLLLEHLPATPPDEWEGRAAALLRTGEVPFDLAETETILAQARTVLVSADLAPFLVAGSLAEVSITGPVPALRGRTVTGVIDRLLILKDRVVALDYKSNAVVPDRPDDVPEGILRQMGAYDALLGAIYPDRRIETVIFWTSRGRLMPLPPDIVRSALASTPIP